MRSWSIGSAAAHSVGLDLQYLSAHRPRALRWKYASVRQRRGARSEVGCHLLFRSSRAAPNCASVCICGDHPPQSPSPMPPRLCTEPNPTSRSYQGILRRLIPTSHGPQYLHNKVKSKRDTWFFFNAFRALPTSDSIWNEFFSALLCYLREMHCRYSDL